jgi:peptidyl-prolyl cis-trans isomerase SurA
VAGGSALLLAGALLLTGTVTLGQSASQVPVPRYQSPLDAPVQQEKLPTVPAPSAITPNGTVVEFAIVRVNDQLIDRSDYLRGQQQLLDEARQTNLSADELAQRQKDLLRDMIDQQLLLSRGKELDINVETDVIRQLDEVRKKYHFDTMEELEKSVNESGISYEDFKANIKNQIMSQKVVSQEVGQTLRLTAKQEQEYYEKHKQEYVQPEQVRLSEILIPTPDAATDEQIAQAKAKAEDVVARLKAGASFEDLAKQMSGGQTASQGGDLGQFKRGALAKALEDPTFALKAGEWTAPIRTRQGYVVLKVTEHTQAGIQPLSVVDQEVQEAIYREAIQPALRTYLTGLREKAYIEIEPGFVDTGASAKQTKPVFAAATPLPVKKSARKKERLDNAHPAATASAAGAAKPGAVVVSTSETISKSAKTTPVAAGKKHKRIHREKIRFGQSPRNSLPPAPEETQVIGTGQGPGTSSMLPAPGAEMASNDQTTSADEDPFAPKGPTAGKTRYSDRAPIEDKARREAAKEAKAKAKAAATPTPMTEEQTAAQKMQAAPLGLGGDTATKTKKKRAKGEAKERLQEKPPAPLAAKPEATPIPPKSVRQNGEPVVSPPPPVPPVTVPDSGAQSSAPVPTK